MQKETAKSSQQKALDYVYEKAINGLPGFDTVEQLAKSYLDKHNNPVDAAKSLVNWHIAKCAASGFITNIGGMMTLPVTIPANIASVLYVQLRMVASIAHLSGYDIKDDQVKTFVFLTLIGQSLTAASKDVGVRIATKTAEQAIKKIPREVITKINRHIGFKLITKKGEKGAINLVKLVPIAGGVVGASIDGITTKIIGKRAIDVFYNKNNDFDVIIIEDANDLQN